MSRVHEKEGETDGEKVEGSSMTGSHFGNRRKGTKLSGVQQNVVYLPPSSFF